MLMNKTLAASILLLGALSLTLGLAAPTLLAQQASGIVPGVWRGDVARPRPDMTGLPPLRIITEADYPPFNYYDEDGTLTGFNVELMQAVCAVMEVACSFEVRDFEALMPSLQRSEADVVAASLSISPENLKIADFSERYYETPARFIGKKTREIVEVTPETVNGLRVGVVAGSKHEAYLRDFFPGVVAMPMKDRDELREALVQDRVDLMFDDGITSVFWLNGTGSKGCCAFRGGPYMDASYFGDGVGLALKKGDRRLRDIINYALEKVRRDGTYEELFLRYFPLSFY
jgi:polar amino acid transport system substrate-binding protein